MEHDEVRDLEDLLEQCLGRMFRGKGAESLPWRPDGQTVHLGKFRFCRAFPTQSSRGCVCRRTAHSRCCPR